MKIIHLSLFDFLEIYVIIKLICPHGQEVKTPPSQGGIRGSIPLEGTNRNTALKMRVFVSELIICRLFQNFIKFYIFRNNKTNI